MNIDRALVKSQAKQIIKGNVLRLFLINLVVYILISGFSIVININSINDFNDEYYNSNDNGSGYSDFFDFGNENSSGGSSSGGFDRGYFDDFTGRLSLQTASLNNNDKEMLLYLIARIGTIVQLVFSPLGVTLMGLYIMTVRGKRFNVSQEFEYVFKKLFDKNYFKKWLLCFLQDLIIILLSLLLIFPGVICYYKYYFAKAIMTDNPEISPTDALRLSKKMTKGHKGELFALDLSFIGWFLLEIITLGLISIYTTPYYFTTKALYYENFRIRAFQEGSVTAFDFMNDAEKASYYQASHPYYRSQQPPAYGSGMGNDYYNNNNF